MTRYEIFSTHYVQALSDDEIGELNYLLADLSPTAEALTRNSLSHILEHSLLVGIRCWNDDVSSVVGMGLLSPIHGLSGFRMHIEDVCVSPLHRGFGLGKQIVQALLSEAQASGARSADLTSHPDREVANALYRSLGFKLRETNVYRFTFAQKPPSEARG